MSSKPLPDLERSFALYIFMRPKKHEVQMESDFGKTRAEILDELKAFHRRTSREKDMNDLLRILNIPTEDRDIVRVVNRAEKEYFLICSRASRRDRGEVIPDAGPDARLNIQDSAIEAAAIAGEPLPSVEGFLQGLERDAATEPSEIFLMKIVLAAGELMRAETSLLALLDSSGEKYSLRAATGPRALDCLGFSLPVKAESVCGWVMRQNSYFTSSDVMTDLRSGPVFCEAVRAQAVAAAPLTQKGVVVGAITVANERGGRIFTRSETLDVLVPFARSASFFLPASM
jgi:hypothetical protein